jgi:hypothetical protein
MVSSPSIGRVELLEKADAQQSCRQRHWALALSQGKYQEDLLWEKLKFPFQRVSSFLHFACDRLARCPVTLELLPPALTIKIDHRNPAVTTEELPSLCEVGDPIVQVVVGIAREDEIDPSVLEERVIRLRQNDLDIPNAFFPGLLGYSWPHQHRQQTLSRSTPLPLRDER